jgi:hypothetical protein
MFPALVEIAETTVVVAARVDGAILFPQQLSGSVLVPLQLFVNMGKVGQRTLGCWLTVFAGIGGKQRRFQL